MGEHQPLGNRSLEARGVRQTEGDTLLRNKKRKREVGKRKVNQGPIKIC
jgi:hypothetical protein